MPLWVLVIIVIIVLWLSMASWPDRALAGVIDFVINAVVRAVRWIRDRGDRRSSRENLDGGPGRG